MIEVRPTGTGNRDEIVRTGASDVRPAAAGTKRQTIRSYLAR